MVYSYHEILYSNENESLKTGKIEYNVINQDNGYPCCGGGNHLMGTGGGSPSGMLTMFWFFIWVLVRYRCSVMKICWLCAYDLRDFVYLFN